MSDFHVSATAVTGLVRGVVFKYYGKYVTFVGSDVRLCPTILLIVPN